MAGMDAIEFLKCEDDVEIMLTLAIVSRWVKRRQELDRNLAHDIVNTLAKSMSKKGPTGAY